jgi:hypothetical protein
MRMNDYLRNPLSFGPLNMEEVIITILFQLPTKPKVNF